MVLPVRIELTTSPLPKGVLSRESQKAASRVPVAVFLAGRDNAARTVSPLSDAPVRNGVAGDRTVAAAARGPRRSRAWRHHGFIRATKHADSRFQARADAGNRADLGTRG
jgi:hypothetical protein